VVSLITPSITKKVRIKIPAPESRKHVNARFLTVETDSLGNLRPRPTDMIAKMARGATITEINAKPNPVISRLRLFSHKFTFFVYGHNGACPVVDNPRATRVTPIIPPIIITVATSTGVGAINNIGAQV
jgi:hypothetical protein